MPKGRPKGGQNKQYSYEEKLRIVKKNTEDHLSSRDISQETGVHDSIIRRWIRSYLSNGAEGLKAKGGRGNRFSALHTSKTLSKEDRLELENLKLKIENERLKKGYMVKGGGANKEYVSISDANTRSFIN